MFKSSKSGKPAKRSKGGSGGAELMQQMGFQIPNFDDPTMSAMDDNDDDADLEAELRQMQQETGGHESKRSKADKKKTGKAAPDLQSFHNDVNKLLSDIDKPINDDDLSDVDEEDLLAELNDITGDTETEKQDAPTDTSQVQSTSNKNILAVLQTRLDMYTKAVQTVKMSGDTARARRIERQLKFIQELIQSVRAGAPINESEIPPELFIATPSLSQSTNVTPEVPLRAPPPPPPESTATSISNDNKTSMPQTQLVTSSNNTDDAIGQLRALALQASAGGNKDKAKEYLIQMKQLQNKAAAISMPPPPPPAQTEIPNNNPAEEISSPLVIPLKAPEPSTVMEALQQRHQELVKQHKEAISKEDNSKARRMDRLAKQYQEAIDATQKGRSYNYSELPDLAGFAPIPVEKPKSQMQSSDVRAGASLKTTDSHQPTQPQKPRPSLPVGPSPPAALKPLSNPQQDQQVQTLRLRQEKFQSLALKAKKEGDIESAKRNLIASKEIEKAIASIESGVPIDTKQLPELPDAGYEFIQDDELTKEIAKSDRETIYQRLQDDLLRQMQLCARNQQIYAQMEGANNSKQANEFKTLEQRSAHDLERLRKCFQHGSKAPLFHYEKRQMNIIQVNNDLSDHEFEVKVLRGINLRLPSGYSSTSLETCVIIEFPYPRETPQTARTRHGAGSTIVEYPDSLHKFQIKRTDTDLKRVFKRKELKLSIFHKAGFLRADRLLGTASVKLAPFEETATIHESVDIYDNEHKKKPEGKLEVKIRMKEALGQTKSSESSLQQWLVIDRFEDISYNSKSSTSQSISTAPSITAISRLVPTSDSLGLLAITLANNLNNNNNNDDDATVESSRSSDNESKHRISRNSQQPVVPQSIQVLKYEADLINEQIEQFEDLFTQDQIDRLRTKQQTLTKTSDEIIVSLRQGGKKAVEEHVRGLEQLMEHYSKEVDEYRQRDENKKADILVKKKDLVAKELETFTSKP
ncbi:unnamed protein product [Rotaria magnacalcarata]|uniref:C2 domain-containing protein n=2 Tax=Rotaria magnacalcarata TaxID=392030 RepID=A0A815VCS9_9BILA|nr:unnamed protein product [Rotaria magnacalcarata]